MFPGRSVFFLSLTSAVVVSLAVFSGGCGSEPADFDQSANYSAESLAQELIERYRALSPSAQISKAAPRNKQSGPASSAKGTASKKSVTKATKKAAPATIDDVLEDIEMKITLVKGTSRAETTKKMIETIGSDKSLAEADKKVLTESVDRMGN
jgi:hypothetical protein